MKEGKDIWTQIGRGTYALVVPDGVLVKVEGASAYGSRISITNSLGVVPCKKEEAKQWVTEMAEEYRKSL